MEALKIIPATLQDATVLFRLMQLYYFEASAWSDEDILPEGLYDCDYADVEATLREQSYWARLLWLDGKLCGFVLVDDVDFQGRCIQELADLFVLPKFRGKGIAAAVVTALVTPETGQWLLATFRDDLRAHDFWRRNLPKMGMTFEIPVDGADDATFNRLLIRAL